MALHSPRMKWPYPAEDSDPWFDTFVDFVRSMDASAYASREDRNIIFTGGGPVSWDSGNGELTFGSFLRIVSPISGFSWQIEAGTYGEISDGQVVYVQINRGTLTNINVTPVIGNSVPSSDDALIVAVRIGSYLYFRNGIALSDGSSVPNIGSGAGGSGGSLGGDVTGSASSNTVTALRGRSIESPFDPADGDILVWDDAASVWRAIGSNGDISGGYDDPVVSGLAGTDLETPLSPDHGDVLYWNDAVSEWQSTAASGDVEGEYTNLAVTGLRGTSLESPLDPSDGDLLVWDSSSESWVTEALSGQGIRSLRFNYNGDLSALSIPTGYIDGLHEVGVEAAIAAVIISQEVDGSGGSTDVEVYKVDTSGNETQITQSGSASLSSGGGALSRSVSASFSPGTNLLEATDRIGVRVTSVQSGSPEDLSVTIALDNASIAASPGLPEDDEVTQAILKSVSGTTFEQAGVVYLNAGTILSAESRLFMGVDNASDDAELEIRDAVTSTLITTITKTGLPDDVQPGSDFSIPSDGWYSLRLRASASGTIASIFGIKLVYNVGQGTRIQQAMNSDVTGNTYQVVGNVYLPAGSMQIPARVFIGATTSAPDAAEMELRRQSDSQLIASWSVSGELAEDTQSSVVTIPSSDWYSIRLRGNDSGVTASIRGIDWTVLT